MMKAMRLQHVTLLVVGRYGSQTGTAESFARRLHGEVSKAAMKAEVRDVAKADVKRVISDMRGKKVNIFCQATYGDGEPTDDANDFFERLESAKGSLELDGVRVAVFGLGNKQYEHFNYAGKNLRNHLVAAGAVEVCEMGLGDDDGDIEADFERWKNHTLLPTLGSQDAGLESDGPSPHWIVVDADESAQSDPGCGIGSAQVVEWKQLCEEGTGKSVVHVELEMTPAEGQYNAGDHLALHPRHQQSQVDDLAECIGLGEREQGLDKPVRLEAPEGGGAALGEKPFEGTKRVKYALAECVELGLPPPRQCLRELAHYCYDDVDSQKLVAIASDSHTYRSEVEEMKLCLSEVLRKLAPSCKPPIGALLAHAGQRLHPRRYSLASSPAEDRERLAITCSVVRGRTPTGRWHEGVASTQLESVQKGESLPVTLRRTVFSLPSDPLAPMIMICAGTGLAPFRGFLRERRAMRGRGLALGECALYFGCRDSHDELYMEELDDHLKGGELTRLRVVHSRERERMYVQDAIASEEEARFIRWALQSGGGMLYVCGDAQGMARGVHSALQSSVLDGDAEGFLKFLSESGRYLRDVW